MLSRSETCYSGVTFPLVEPGLRQIVRSGYRRVVVFPYFLFSGVLVSRIVEHTRRVAADHPQIDFRSANYLGDHAGVLDTFRERVLDVLRGDTAMNCSLCKYRAQVLGFEQEVGLPQQSHHHHVEGLIESCTLCERECTGACQPDGVPLPLAGGAGAHAAPPAAPGPQHTHGHSHGQGHSHGHSHSHDHSQAQAQGHEHEHAHSHSHELSQDNPPDDHLGHGQGPQARQSQDHSPSPGELAQPHHHHHHPYPHADHPLGPRTLRTRLGMNDTSTPSSGEPSPGEN